MRVRLISLGLAGGLVLALLGSAGVSLAADAKVPGSVKKNVEKLIGRLVGGDIDASQTQAREQIFNDLDRALEKDKKGVAIRSPNFWVDTITASYFAGKSRRSATHKKVTKEKMQVSFTDGSAGDVDIAFWGAAAYSSKVPHPLLLCVIPETEDLGTYIESTWLVHESVKKGWVVAAVAESDKYPIGKQTWMAGFAYVHMRSRFNIDPNRFYLAAEGAACETIQKVATTAIPDRIAGLVLIKPTKAVTSKNSSLYSAVVVHEGADDATAKTYLELDPGRNRAIPADDMSMPAVATWLGEHPGRVLPASYTWETPTTEDGTTMPWTGSLWIESPQKRGQPVTVAVHYEAETNSVKMQGENLGEFIVCLNDNVLNLDDPIQIVVNDEVLVTRRFERQVRTMFRIADTYGEYGRVFTAEFRGFAPAPPDPAPEDGDGVDGDGVDGDE